MPIDAAGTNPHLGMTLLYSYDLAIQVIDPPGYSRRAAPSHPVTPITDEGISLEGEANLLRLWGLEGTTFSTSAKAPIRHLCPLALSLLEAPLTEERRRHLAALVEDIEAEAAARREKTGMQPMGAATFMTKHPHAHPSRTKKSPAPRFHGERGRAAGLRSLFRVRLRLPPGR